MALTEDQIQRYARQVLLKGVGGKGQEKLLAAAAVARGSGLALETAVAYLRAGGTPVSEDPGSTEPRDRTLLPRAGEGGPPGGTDRMRVDPGTSRAVASASTLERETDSFAVVLGGRNGAPHVQATDCRDCLRALLTGLGPVPDDHAVYAGALAALVYQRQVLGLAPHVAPGVTPIFCEAHR